MLQLNPKGRLWLKVIHILFAAFWVGGTVCMLILILANSSTSNHGNSIYGLNLAVQFIDNNVTIPSAIGCFVTGLLISWFTAWGFFKHLWVTIKWILTGGTMITGAMLLGPRINIMTQISKEEGIKAFNNIAYLSARQSFLTLHTIQVLVIIFMIVISVIKPWKKKTQKNLME